MQRLWGKTQSWHTWGTEVKIMWLLAARRCSVTWGEPLERQASVQLKEALASHNKQVEFYPCHSEKLLKGTEHGDNIVIFAFKSY